MVEIEPPFGSAAASAPVPAFVSIQPLASLPYIASNVGSVALWVVAVALSLTLLVALPCFRRVIGLATCHEHSMDYWGDESLGTAEMPGAA